MLAGTLALPRSLPGHKLLHALVRIGDLGGNVSSTPLGMQTRSEPGRFAFRWCRRELPPAAHVLLRARTLPRSYFDRLRTAATSRKGRRSSGLLTLPG